MQKNVLYLSEIFMVLHCHISLLWEMFLRKTKTPHEEYSQKNISNKISFLPLYKELTKTIIRFDPNFIKILALRGFIRDISFSFSMVFIYMAPLLMICKRMILIDLIWKGLQIRKILLRIITQYEKMINYSL